jgi:hypothetical protein
MEKLMKRPLLKVGWRLFRCELGVGSSGSRRLGWQPRQAEEHGIQYSEKRNRKSLAINHPSAVFLEDFRS